MPLSTFGREELLNAMKLLSHQLADVELGLVMSCLDIHGYVTPDQVGLWVLGFRVQPGHPQL